MLVYLERGAIGVKTIKWRSAFTSLLVFLLAISFTLPYDVMAHEFSPKRYWNDIYFNSNIKKHIVRLNVNIKNVTNTVYNRVLRDAINNWNSFGDGYCDIQITTSGSQLMVYDQYPSTQNQNAYAVTVSTLSSANIFEYPYGITGGATSISCKKITKAKIYVNINKQSANNFNEQDISKTWAHEIGHVMGLNETNDGTRSVMRQGKGSTFGWSNYWQPQAHDTADLSRYRYVSWS